MAEWAAERQRLKGKLVELSDEKDVLVGQLEESEARYGSIDSIRRERDEGLQRVSDLETQLQKGRESFDALRREREISASNHLGKVIPNLPGHSPWADIPT